MISAPVPSSSETLLRRFILALFSFGVLGTGTELIALGHFEDSWQWVPLFLLSLALAGVLLHLLAHGAMALRLLRTTALFMIIAGGIGVFLHYRGNMEFQLETNPDLSGLALFQRIIHSKVPPALAPGVMAQLGLLGLIYCYRHPDGRRVSDPAPR
jgi:hypothetical protein